jgi:hypothetical protein
MTVSVKAPTSTTGSIQLNGSDVLTIDSSGNLTAPNDVSVTGNVGIGTSSPTSPLSVSGISSLGVDQTDYINVRGGGGTGRVETVGTNTNINLALSTKGTGSFYVWRGGYGGTNTLLIDGSSNLKFNSGYGSVATAYGCRAWVNFNGTGTVAIRDSGNVSSITDSGVGDYRVNFSTAMPDTDYAVVGSCQGVSGSDIVDFGSFGYGGSPTVTPTTSQVAVGAFAYSGASVDTAIVSVAVFR